MISFPSYTLSKMACSLVKLKEMQSDFSNCSRMKMEEHQNLLDENSCQLVTKVIKTCGRLWERCHTRREVRRMSDLHIEAMIRQYQSDEHLNNCPIVKEYRYGLFIFDIDKNTTRSFHN